MEKDPSEREKEIKVASAAIISFILGLLVPVFAIKFLLFIFSIGVFSLFAAELIQSFVPRGFYGFMPSSLFAIAAIAFYFGCFEYPISSTQPILLSVGVCFGSLGLFFGGVWISMFFAKKKIDEEE